MAIVDKKTPRLGLLLPNADNFLQDDVERLIQSFDLLYPGSQLVVGTIARTAEYVSRAVDAAAAGCKVRIIFDGNIPSGASVDVFISGVDAGDAWQQVSLDQLKSPIAVGDNVYEYNYVKEDVMEAKVRVKLVLNGTPAARPYVYSLRVSVIENS